MRKFILVTLVIVISFVLGFAVGRVSAPTVTPPEKNQTTEESEIVTDDTSSSTATTNNSETTNIETDTLSPDQKKLLESFGIEAESVVVTQAMINCARTKLGEARLEEIINGSAPTFFEGLDLVSCYKK